MVATVGGIYAVNEDLRFSLDGFNVNFLTCKRLRLEHDLELVAWAR